MPLRVLEHCGVACPSVCRHPGGNGNLMDPAAATPAAEAVPRFVIAAKAVCNAGSRDRGGYRRKA